jgi:adenosine kinase
MVYATAFFITSNVEAMRQVGRYCAENDKPMVFNIAAPFLLFTNFDDVMDAIEHADYVFCNEDEASTFAEKQGFQAADRRAAGKYMCQYKKANAKRNRVSIVTQGAEPIIVHIGQGEGKEPIYMEIPIPAIAKEKIVDTNGCGDACVGGFLAAMHQGKSLQEALVQGVSISGHVLCQDGATYEGY